MVFLLHVSSGSVWTLLNVLFDYRQRVFGLARMMRMTAAA
jgi:hypothetical protein